MNVNFREIIEKIKKATGLNQKQIAAEVFDISDKNLSNRIKGNRIDFFKLVKWAVNNNVDLNWLLVSKKLNQGSNIVISIDPAQRIADGFLEKWDRNLDAEGIEKLVEFFRKIYLKRLENIEQEIIDETVPELIEALGGK
jgi:hypothetical protein